MLLFKGHALELFNFVDDFKSIRLSDRRLDKRLSTIISAVGGRPDLSFPESMPSKELLGYYRFASNDDVSFGEVLWPHIEEATRRSAQKDDLLVLHDTCDFECSCVSFRGQFSLAVGIDRSPCGFLSVLPMRRGSQENKQAGEPNEQDRWFWGIWFAFKRAPNSVQVLDREGDDYRLLAWLEESKIRFVIRSKANRRLLDGQLLNETLRTANVVAERTVRLSSRTRLVGNKTDRKSHPLREERLAKLAISAAPVSIKKAGTKKQAVALNAVHVRELDAPEGVEPIEWRLLTTEPIDTAEQILRIVDIYRTRWMIEEFFKALKTGCEFEKRQHESFEAIVIALAIFIPIALQMLHLRHLSRIDADVPAQEVLSAVQLRILSKLPRTSKFAILTVKQALLAIAALGGHLKNNGEPGWITLGRGFLKLQTYEVGWQLAVGPEM